MNNRIYLCYQDKTNSCSFNCKLFNSFIEADNYYHTTIFNIKHQNSTMIPIFKYSPIFFDKFILKYNIQNMFCNINININ